MKKWIWGISGVLLLFLIAIMLLVSRIDLDTYKDHILPRIEEAIHRKVEVGHVALSLWPPIGVRLDRVRIQDDPRFSDEPFLSSRDLILHVRFLPLFQRRVEVVSLTLQQPEVVLIENSEGILNVTTIGGPRHSSSSPPSSPDLSSSVPAQILGLLGIDRLRIEGGKIKYIRKLRSQDSVPLYEVRDLDLIITDLGLGKTVNVKAAMVMSPSGRLDFSGQAGPLSLDLHPQVVNLMLKTGRSDVKIEGGARQNRWVFNVSSQHVLSEDLIGPARGILPPGLKLSGLSGLVELEDEKVKVSKLTANMFSGKVMAAGQIGFSSKNWPFEGNLRVEAVDLGQALEVYTPSRGLLAGTASLDLSVMGSGTDGESISQNLRGKGTFTVRDGKLPKSRLLEQVLTALEALRLTSIQSSIPGGDSLTAFSLMEGGFRIDQGNIYWDRLSLVARDFDLEAQGSTALNQRLDLQGQMILSEAITQLIHPGGVAGLVLVKKGRLAVPLHVKGTVERPIVTMDTGTIGRESARQLKEKIFQRLFK